MQFRPLSLVSPLIAVATLSFMSCVGGFVEPDQADQYTSDALVTYSDGFTPIAGFSATSYDAIFWLNGGANIVRTFQHPVQLNSGTTSLGVRADAVGQFSIAEADVALSRVINTVNCTDSCIYNTECEYDFFYDDITCYEVCDLVTSCRPGTAVSTYDFRDVVAVETNLNYLYNGNPAYTVGDASYDAPNDVVSAWDRVETFVTPFVRSPSVAASPITEKSAKQPVIVTGKRAVKRRLGCNDQLTADQAKQVLALRKALGVSTEQNLCGK